MKCNAAVSHLILIFVFACSGGDENAQDPFTFVLPDSELVDAMVPDMETIERPEGCTDNANLARLLPVLTGGKNHPTGRGEHALSLIHI